MSVRPVKVLAELIEQSVIEPHEVVQGRIKVTEVPARNSNYIVRRQRGLSVFAKMPIGQRREETIRRERKVYRHLLLHKLGPRSSIPYCIPLDEMSSLLALEYIEDATSLHWIGEDRNVLSAPLLESIAQSLALIHAVEPSEEDIEGYGLDPPWILQIGEPDIAILRHASKATIELVAKIQTSPIVQDCLRSLRNHWETKSWIHGDLKLANILVPLSSNTPPNTHAEIIDWEMAGVGTLSWDLGSFIGDLALQLCLSHQWPVEFIEGLGSDKQSEVHTILHDFWAAYSAYLRLCSLQAVPILNDTIRFASARILQSTYERCQHLDEISPVEDLAFATSIVLADCSEIISETILNMSTCPHD